MNATDLHEEQRARLPTDYIGGTCEGRQASPSNPNQTHASGVKEGLSESVIFRCTPSEKAALVAKARAAGLPNATLMREALGLIEARRRKPVPRVDPKLTFAIARVGGKTEQYVISMKLKKKIEMLFAHLKRILGLNRLRSRGPCGANDEFLLAATAQTLRKLAKHCPAEYWRSQCTRGILPAPQQPRKA